MTKHWIFFLGIFQGLISLQCKSLEWFIFDHFMYGLSTSTRTYNVASVDCYNAGGQLAAVTDNRIHSFLNDLMVQPNQYWIGAVRNTSEFFWEYTGEMIETELWYISEPTKGIEDIVVRYLYSPSQGGFRLADTRVWKTYGYICRKINHCNDSATKGIFVRVFLNSASINYDRMFNSTTGSMIGCGAECLKYTSCVMFGYTSGISGCYIYSYALNSSTLTATVEQALYKLKKSCLD